MIKPVLAICSLQYDPGCVWSLIELIKTNFFVGHVQVTTTLLPGARNTAIQQALLNNPDFTHLLFIDDDMVDFTIDHVEELVKADKDIISALVTMRKPPYTIPIELEGENSFDMKNILSFIKEERILPALHTGMAFTLIKRNVIDKLAEDTPKGQVWFTMDREPRDTFHKEMMQFAHDLKNKIVDGISLDVYTVISDAVAFGMSAHIGSDLLGEDIAFCKRAKKFGFQPFVHCGVIVGHMGSKPITVRDTIKFNVDEQVRMSYNKGKEGVVHEKQELTKSSVIAAV